MTDISLTINKEVVNPIVEAKIKSAVLEALGGSDVLIEKVVEQILNTKVNEKGNISSYSNDNKHKWIDIVLTKQINEIAKEAIKEAIQESGTQIKDVLVKHLQSKRGSSLVAKAMVDGLTQTFKNSWTSKIDISLNPKENH